MTKEERREYARIVRLAFKDDPEYQTQTKEYARTYRLAMKDDPSYRAKEKARAHRTYLRKKKDAKWYKGLSDRRADWAKNNPERNLATIKDAQARRREQKMGSISELTNEQVGEIRGIYLQCDRLNGILGGQVFEVDHTVPLSKGGKHHPNNLQIVPRSWNREKGNSHSERWEVPFANNLTN